MVRKSNVRQIKKIYSLLKKGNPRFLIYILLNSIMGLILILYAGSLSKLINSLSKWDKNKILFWLGMLVIVRLVGLLTGKWMRHEEKNLWSKNVTNLRETFMEKLQHFSSDTVEKYMNSDLMTRFSDDLEATVMLFNDIFVKIITNLLVIVCILIYVDQVDWRMNIIVLVLFPGILYLVLKKGKDVEHYSDKVQTKKSALNGHLKDILEHRIEIQSYEAENFFSNKSSESIQLTLKDGLKLYFHERVVWASEIIFYELFHLSYFIIGALLAYSGKTQIGFVVGAMLLNGCLVERLFNLPNLYASFKSTLPKLKRYLEILEAESNLEQLNNIKSKDENLAIEISHLNFKYKNIHAIKDVSLKIKSGEKVAIIGESGSGKSTLLKLIAGYSNNFQGDINIFGNALKEENMSNIYSKISYMPQDLHLFNKSIEENLLMFSSVSEEQCFEQFKSVADLVSISEEIQQLENGYKTEVAPGMENLSKGQVQRIGWMICLMKNAPLIMIDEGFSSIDYEKIQCIFKQLMDDNSKTVVMITHVLNESILKKFDRIFLIEDGKVTLQGSHELLKDEKKYRAFYAAKRSEAV